jgi:hypothetical protein
MAGLGADRKTSQVKMVDERLVFIRDYARNELSAFWQRLTAERAPPDPNDKEDREPTIVLENTDTRQSMTFRMSPPEITAYTDFDPPSDYAPTTVAYARARENIEDAWGPWIAEALDP